MASVTPEREAAGLALAPRSPGRRRTRWAAYAGAAVVLAALVGWVSTHPAELPTSDRQVSASTPAGQPVFLGVFGAPADFDRSLHISGVRVSGTSTVPVEVVPHVCRGGTVNVTTTPATFCSEVVPSEGATLGAGDQLLLEVTGEGAGTVELDRVRVSYRDGVQWAAQDAGSPSVVTILGR